MSDVIKFNPKDKFLKLNEAEAICILMNYIEMRSSEVIPSSIDILVASKASQFLGGPAIMMIRPDPDFRKVVKKHQKEFNRQQWL